jgi:hypothetical protein
MRKLIITAVAAVALTGAAACSSPAEKAADSQAEAIQAQGEANAEKLEADARVTQTTAEAQADAAVAHGEATADAMTAAADQTKKDANAQADAVRDAAKH